ncbi:MAG: pyridoxal phosphate-dependent aminotransferase [Myxococcota bacterium]
MPVLSARGTRLPASPIRRLAPLATAARARGVTVYPLNIGQPDLPLPPPLREAVQTTDLSMLSYTPSDGEPATRQAIATFLGTRDIKCNPDDLIVTNGGSEALLLAFMAICDPGDEIICPEPLYANYVTLAMLAGVTVKGVATTAADGYRLPTTEALRAAVTPRTRGILWSSPSNPTGAVYTLEELTRLARLAQERDLYLLADEVYADFFFGAVRAPSIRDLPDDVAEPDRVIVVDSASKRWAACGARLGWLYTRNQLVKGAVMRAAMGRLSPPMISEKLVQAVTRLGPEYYTMVQAEYRRRRDITRAGIEAIKGAKAGSPEGAFYLFAELPVDDSDRFSEFLLKDFHHNNETVCVAPGSGFYASPQAVKKEIRIAYVVEQDKLKRAMEVLGEAVKAYNRLGG